MSTFRVTFSEVTENIENEDNTSKGHKKLSRKENVLSSNNLNPKSILVNDNNNKQAGKITNDYIEKEEGVRPTVHELQAEEHYKTLKGAGDDYSYAYR